MPVPNIAVNILRETPPFRNASLRMLRDLVELGTIVDTAKLGHQQRACDIDAALIVVCKGALRLCPKPAAENAADTKPRERFLRAGSMHWTARTSGVVLQGNDPEHVMIADVPFVAKPSGPDDTQFLWFSESQLTRFLGASPHLAAAVDPVASTPRMQLKLRAPNSGNHAILLCHDKTVAGAAAALEPLAHLLAASLASQFREPTTVVTFADARHTAMDLAGFEPCGRPMTPASRSTADPFDWSRAPRNGGPDLRHVIYVEPPSGLRHPGIQERQYHRIVYVTDQLPRGVPRALAERLYGDLMHESSAYFSAFIAAILLPKRDVRSNGPLDFLGNFFWPATSQFKSVAYPLDGSQQDDGLACHQRIDRDSCRLRLDPTSLVHSWQTWRSNGGQGSSSSATRSFTSEIVPEYREAIDRLARAVTNRRVGVALSGGGAASYRLIPVLRRLREAGVPIDVVGGISGGSLLAAYYCAKGLEGLKKAAASGPQLGSLLPFAIFSSWLIENRIDTELEYRPLDDLEVRYVAMAATTDQAGRPEAHAITHGTLGEAVRVSGAAPGLFAPTEKNGHRYADGTIALAIPARLLKDYGADLVFACNSIPPPVLAERHRTGWGKFWYRETVLGRPVDLGMSLEFLIERLSAEIADDAHCYIGFPPMEDGLETTIRYGSAERFATEKLHPTVQLKIQECVDRWSEFLKGGRS